MSCHKVILILILISSSKIFADDYLNDDGLKFIVVGDWGRKGEYFQKDVANQMAIVSEKVKVSFIVSTGDNFYDNGVSSTEDELWKLSFTDIYNHKSLQIPWYVSLGNHDYRSNPQAEIDYTSKSSIWNMPSRYFTIDKKSNDGTNVKLIFIDSNPFIKDYHSEAKYSNQVKDQDTLKQKLWLDSVLSISNADLNIVVGHHPPLSSSPKHGGASEIYNLIQGYGKTKKVKYTFWGHEHDLQHQHLDNFPEVFVSGAGSECRETSKNATTKFALGKVGGFALVSIENKKLSMQFIDFKGNVVYTYKSE